MCCCVEDIFISPLLCYTQKTKIVPSEYTKDNMIVNDYIRRKSLYGNLQTRTISNLFVTNWKYEYGPPKLQMSLDMIREKAQVEMNIEQDKILSQYFPKVIVKEIKSF